MVIMMHHKIVESGNILAETNILQGIWSKVISSCMFLATVACGCFFVKTTTNGQCCSSIGFVGTARS